MLYCARHILALSAENDVDPVSQRPVLLWDGKPRLPTHDHHILLPCSTEGLVSLISLHSLKHRQFLVM